LARKDAQSTVVPRTPAHVSTALGEFPVDGAASAALQLAFSRDSHVASSG
jgi:hypothetical protein